MGILYVIATPIGNLKDITFRAIEVLKSVNIIACEDTRVTHRLLTHYSITGKKLISYHEHNEEEAAKKLVSILEKEDIALVSDAGTPCISDPGYRVVKLAWEKGYQVVPIPGAFAGAVALSASGLPTDRFLFEGFLPNKKEKKLKRLQELINIGITFILYESPKRVLNTLQNINELAPESDIVVAKELTKIHEKFFRGKPVEVIQELSSKEEYLKGEFVIICHPILEKHIDTKEIEKTIKELLSQGLKSKEIAKIISQQYKIPKNQAYKIVINIPR